MGKAVGYYEKARAMFKNICRAYNTFKSLQIHLSMSGMSVFFYQIAARTSYGSGLFAVEAKPPKSDFTSTRATLLSIK
jgi:hypothetical protein